MSSFGVLLRQFRLSAGLTQEMLARRACLSMRAIQHLERGLGQPHRETSQRLAEALTLSADQLRVFEVLAAPSPRRPRRRQGGSWTESAVGSPEYQATLAEAISASVARGFPETAVASLSEPRWVTVVVADIVEPARYFELLGPDEAVNLLDAMLRSMRSAVSQFHGSVTRIDHEGMTVLFGAAADAHDHAPLACRAAVEMQQAVSRLSDDRHNWYAVEPQVRLGLASGEVVLRPLNAALSADYTAAGLPFHIAARIARLSTPSSICLSAETMRLVEGCVQVRARESNPPFWADQSTTGYELIEARS